MEPGQLCCTNVGGGFLHSGPHSRIGQGTLRCAHARLGADRLCQPVRFGTGARTDAICRLETWGWGRSGSSLAGMDFIASYGTTRCPRCLCCGLSLTVACSPRTECASRAAEGDASILLFSGAFPPFRDHHIGPTRLAGSASALWIGYCFKNTAWDLYGRGTAASPAVVYEPCFSRKRTGCRQGCRLGDPRGRVSSRIACTEKLSSLAAFDRWLFAALRRLDDGDQRRQPADGHARSLSNRSAGFHDGSRLLRDSV